MNPIEKLKNYKPEMTKAELAAADYIIENPISVVQFTLTELAENSGSSNAAIIRLCQKMNYEGFKEFKFSMSRYLVSDRSGFPDNSGKNNNSLASVTSNYIHYLNLLNETVSLDTVKQIAADICAAKSITIFGINRTGFSAMQLSYRLSRLGIASRPITDNSIMLDYADMLSQGDICIIFTIRGKGSKDYGEYMQRMKNQGCKVILFTMDPKINLIKLPDTAIVLPCISKKSGEAFLDDQAIFFVFIEVLLREISLRYTEE